MRSLGYPLVVSEMLSARTTSHQCGTVRMGAGFAARGPGRLLPHL